MKQPTPPQAKIIPTPLTHHNHTRTDDYYWLNKKEDPAVIDYLTAENNYTSEIMEHTQPLQAELFQELKNRIPQDDMSVPYQLDDYYYYIREENGKDHIIYCRKFNSLDAAEEIILDVNNLAKDHEFISVTNVSPSPDHSIIAYAVDTNGSRIHDINFVNLAAAKSPPATIRQTTGNFVWGHDNNTIYYSKADVNTLRYNKIYKNNTLIYEELDEKFDCYIDKTKSRKYLLITSSSKLTSEVQFLPIASPNAKWQMFLPREMGHEYSLEHLNNKFYIISNQNAKNFKLMAADITSHTNTVNWQEIIPHRTDVLLEDFDLFNHHLVLQEKHHGLNKLFIRPWDKQPGFYLPFDETCYTAEIGTNPNLDTDWLRFNYTSMTTPGSIYDYNMTTGEQLLKKQNKVLGNDFKIKNYTTQRLWATANDGSKIPISLVYRQDKFNQDGSNPLLLYGYGSYGHSLDASFSYGRLSLLDRGVVYAIAHVRGGEELGRHWYEGGKFLTKKNTFTDFITCAEFLIANKYAHKDKLSAWGGSAGGLLVGSVINMRPDLFKAAIADVPFVDVATTMLDPSLPLTTGEYEEWGNPQDKQYYDYILSYSPYDNVVSQNYPNLLVTTSLNDSQVQYWEPAKWVAKLRKFNTGNNKLLFKTEMNAGHGGVSGRDNIYKDIAFEYAFLLDTVGLF